MKSGHHMWWTERQNIQHIPTKVVFVCMFVCSFVRLFGYFLSFTAKWAIASKVKELYSAISMCVVLQVVLSLTLYQVEEVTESDMKTNSVCIECR